MTARKIAIIGAGISGLTAAIAFARRNHSVTIFEETDELQAIGAGLQLSPNASRILESLEVPLRGTSDWFEPREVRMLAARELTEHAAIPIGALAETRWRAPYGVMSRAGLQRLLLARAKEMPAIRLQLGTFFEAESAGTVLSQIDAGPKKRFDLIIGADGVHSEVRNLLKNPPRKIYSGNLAWRLKAPLSQAPRQIKNDSVSVCMGSEGHLVAYPMSAEGTLNLVAIGPGLAAAHADHGADVDPSTARTMALQFATWHPAIRQMIGNATDLGVWPIYKLENGQWSNAKDTILIGDAAHAMLPFSAQGAAMGIEDAYELASFVSEAVDIPSALQQFERHRKRRLEKVVQRTELNRFAYHARGPFKIGRNLVFRLRGGRALGQDLDWLYDYRAVGLD